MKFIESLDPKRFTLFNEQHPTGDALQTIEWGKLKSKGDWSMELVGLEDPSGTLVAAAMFLRRKLPVMGKSILYAPRGYVLDYKDLNLVDEMTRCMKEYGKKTGAILVKIDPCIMYQEHSMDGAIVPGGINNSALIEHLKSLDYAHKGTNLDFEGVQPRFVFQLDIHRTKEELLNSFHHKTRYNIKVAQKKGVEIYEGSREDLKEFERIMRVTGTRDEFITRPLKYFQDMYDALVPAGKMKLFMAKYNVVKANELVQAEMDALKRKTKIDEAQLAKLEANQIEIQEIMKAHPDGIVVSGTILLINGKTATYLYGASDNVYRNLMPNYLIQWEMISYAKDQDCTLYDFRGISGDLDPDNHLYGLYRFKSGFNGEFVEYIGEFDLVVSPMWFRIWEIGIPMVKKWIRQLKKIRKN